MSTILMVSNQFCCRDSSYTLTWSQTSTQKIQYGGLQSANPLLSMLLHLCVCDCLCDGDTEFFTHGFQMMDIFFPTTSWLVVELRYQLFGATFAVSYCNRCKTPKNSKEPSSWQKETHLN